MKRKFYLTPKAIHNSVRLRRWADATAKTTTLYELTPCCVHILQVEEYTRICLLMGAWSYILTIFTNHIDMMCSIDLLISVSVYYPCSQIGEQLRLIVIKCRLVSRRWFHTPPNPLPPLTSSTSLLIPDDVKSAHILKL